MSRKADYHAGGKWFIHGPKHHKENQLLSLKHHCWLSLALNVPGDCGSSRPTRVEPRFHCVGIEWQVRGRCVGSAAHSPLHAIAARAIEPRPTHFARVRALAVPRTHNAARALCVGPRILRGLAHFVTRALGGPRIDILFHAIVKPFNLLSKQITPNII